MSLLFSDGDAFSRSLEKLD